MPDNELPGFLIIGLIIVVADGQVLYRGGRRYLSGPDGGEGTGSMAWMVVTVFHLVSFGLLALLSVVGPSWSGSTAALVGRLGVFLLLMAVAHALTLSVLGRRRQDHIVEAHYQDREGERATVVEPVGYPVTEVEVEPVRRTASDATWQSAVTPVPGQGGPHPHVSPDLENRGPYRA
jgi:membrane protein implicated in regulation of membrane protease activity